MRWTFSSTSKNFSKLITFDGSLINYFKSPKELNSGLVHPALAEIINDSRKSPQLVQEQLKNFLSMMPA